MKLNLKNLVLILLVFTVVLLCDEQISCVLHVHTKYSGEIKYSIEDIILMCKKFAIDSVIITDHDLIKVEFGIKPFHRVIKKSVEKNSVLKEKPEKYLQEIKWLNEKYPEIVIIPGIETTPFYYWSVQKETLILNNWHKHLLIVGIDEPQYFYNLPIIGNEYRSGRFVLYSLWPICLLPFLLILKPRLIKFLLCCIIFLVLLINFPYKYLPYDQYKNYNELPYQNLINYVNLLKIKNKKNYLIIWSHPEARNYQNPQLITQIKNLKIYAKTEPYPYSLLNTHNYDGFAIFAEGYRKIGKPGGLWDKMLTEYCQGKREKPVWCFSEIDFAEGSDQLNTRKNIVFVSKKSQEEILYSLSKGRFYALWCEGKKELKLENFVFVSTENVRKDKKTKFFVWDSSSSVIATYGEKIFNQGKVVIDGVVKFTDDSQNDVRIYIIRNSEVINILEGKTPYRINFVDENVSEVLSKETKKCYYRIFIESNYPHMLATNPIFVE